jgi:hypothetical protein
VLSDQPNRLRRIRRRWRDAQHGAAEQRPGGDSDDCHDQQNKSTHARDPAFNRRYRTFPTVKYKEPAPAFHTE